MWKLKNSHVDGNEQNTNNDGGKEKDLYINMTNSIKMCLCRKYTWLCVHLNYLSLETERKQSLRPYSYTGWIMQQNDRTH